MKTSKKIVREIQRFLKKSKITSISISDKTYDDTIMQELSVDDDSSFDIQLGCAVYLGNDRENKEITGKQANAILGRCNIEVHKSLDYQEFYSLTRVSAMVVLKYSYKYPYQRFVMGDINEFCEENDYDKNVFTM